jgi:hypothetical protein
VKRRDCGLSEVLSRHFSRVTELKHERAQSELAISLLRFKPGTFRLQIQTVTAKLFRLLFLFLFELLLFLVTTTLRPLGSKPGRQAPNMKSKYTEYSEQEEANRTQRAIFQLVG